MDSIVCHLENVSNYWLLLWPSGWNLLNRNKYGTHFVCVCDRHSQKYLHGLKPPAT